MPDRANIMKGLTEIAEYMLAKADIAGVGKGKEVFDSWYRAADDACELLKEQEPRVLTLEEARRAEYCVMELRDRKELMQFVHDERGGYFSPSLNGREHPYFEDIAGDDEYNVHVRCWSAIPTDEQRKEVKWK